MGMIGNIRKQSNLLIIVIALGMLLFLVPWDSFLALIGAGQYQESGEINGTAIGRVEYENQRAIRSAFSLTRIVGDVGFSFISPRPILPAADLVQQPRHGAK